MNIRHSISDTNPVVSILVNGQKNQTTKVIEEKFYNQNLTQMESEKNGILFYFCESNTCYFLLHNDNDETKNRKNSNEADIISK